MKTPAQLRIETGDPQIDDITIRHIQRDAQIDMRHGINLAIGALKAYQHHLPTDYNAQLIKELEALV